MKTFFKYLLYFFLTLVGCLLSYSVAAWGLSRIPTKEETCTPKTIECYILSNGVHTDLVLPLENELKNWNNTVSPQDTKGKQTTYEYVGFGWGSKGFYLETPTWDDLTFSTAFKATFGLGTTAIHTTFYNRLQESNHCIKIKLCPAQYKKLVLFIENSFQKDGAETIHIKTEANYGLNDAFYEAKGTYNLFTTCNTWANNGLKACHQKTAFWTPFDKGILYHYNKE